MRVAIVGVGLLSGGLEGWDKGREVLRGMRPFYFDSLPDPDAGLLPANERRRSTVGVRWALHVAQEAMAQSQNLSSISAAALQGLDYLDRGEKPPTGWEQQQLTLVQQAYQPKAQVLLMVCPAIQKLIQFSAGAQITELALPQRAAE